MIVGVVLNTNYQRKVGVIILLKGLPRKDLTTRWGDIFRCAAPC